MNIIPRDTLDSLLARVEKPSRYAGGELNQVVKDLDSCKATWAFAFPDVYDLGMDNQGLQILYAILNNQEGVACERVFAPWPDMEDAMRARDVPLFTLESKAEVRGFDIFALTVPYEIILSNVVNMIDLAGLPLLAEERGSEYPLVIGGGAVAFNPEPVADFFDAFVIGEGEEVILEISQAVEAWKAEGKADKDAFLERLTKIRGVYVPKFFTPEYDDAGALTGITPKLKKYRRVFRRVVTDLNDAPYPTKPVVPTLQTIHDRLSVEIQRGCTAGCRFCQAGMIYRPTRERSPEQVLHLIEEGLENTGYEGVSLMSLSAGDYSYINSLLRATNERYEKDMISVNVPSLRVKTLTKDVALEVARVKKGGFTIAPEAGSQRMRDAINKDVTDEEIVRTVETIFTTGGQSVKMYFMCGLPDEIDDDLRGIAELGILALETAKKHHRRPKVTVSVSTFVPKPFTPYQWARQIDREDTLRRHWVLKESLRGYPEIQLRLHEEYGTFLEGVFSRAGRELAPVLIEAQKLGCRLDGWMEHINPELWTQAFANAGVDPIEYLRERDLHEPLPWDHIEAMIGKAWLRKEWDKHLKALYIPDCRWGECGPCGACRKDIRITTYDGQDPLGPEVEPGIGRTYFHPEAQLDAIAPRDWDRKSEEVKDSLAKLPFHSFRIRYSKEGPARFAGHLEVVRAFQRGLKRLKVPLRHSQGFRPHPKIVLSPPLPIGVESRHEYLDIEVMEMDGFLTPTALKEALNNGHLPEGVAVMEAGPTVGHPINGPCVIDYEIDLPASLEPEAIQAAAAAYLAAEAYPVMVRNKERNAKPYVVSLSAEGHVLKMSMRMSSSTGSLKPAILTGALFPHIAQEDLRIRKIGLTFTEDGVVESMKVDHSARSKKASRNRGRKRRVGRSSTRDGNTSPLA